MAPSSLSLVTTLALIFASAIVGGALARWLKQPMILGYIAVGIIVGGFGASIIDRNFTSLISDVGVTLLLFTLGIEFSFQRLFKIISSVSWAAIVQILVSLVVFLTLFSLLGFSFLPALFIAAAASLSSTAIVVKLFSERGELETVPGELATGWLVVQDLAVIPMMIVLPGIAAVTLESSGLFGELLTVLAISVVKASIFLAVIIFLGRRGLPKILALVASLGSREILTLSTVGLVFVSALLAYALGLSAPLGAFIAGLLVAETSLNHAIFAEIRPLRDLFVVVFFVALGMSLPIQFFASRWLLLILLTVGVLFSKWFLVAGLCRFLGYHRKTAFLVALSLTQISEFGFIIAKEGHGLGALSTNDYTLLVGLIFATIFVSSPFIAHGHSVYYWFYRALGRFWPKIFAVKEELTNEREEYPITGHIVICGYGRVGKYIGRALSMVGIPFLVVDYNHATIAELRAQGINVVYGDPADKDVLDFAQVDLARALVIAIPDRHTQEMIIAGAQTLNRRIKIICRTHHEEDQKDLKALGVHTIIQPEFEAALSIVTRLLTDFGVSAEEIAGKVSRLKIEHGLG